MGHGAGQVADAADVGGAFGDRDGAACVEQIEGMGGLEHLFVCGQRQLGAHQVDGGFFMLAEGVEKKFDIAVLEIVG